MPRYIVRAARADESNSGWIWIGGPSHFNPKQRSIVKITREGFGRGLYVDARPIDKNFLDRYDPEGETASDSPKGAKKRIRIHRTTDDKNAEYGTVLAKLDTIVAGQWYRHALGISRTTFLDPGKNGIDLKIEKVDYLGVEALFAACHHPDLTVRLGTRLGVLGVWLGLVQFADQAADILGPHLPWCKGSDAEHGTLKWAIVIISGAVGMLLCRGRPPPALK